MHKCMFLEKRESKQSAKYIFSKQNKQSDKETKPGDFATHL